MNIQYIKDTDVTAVLDKKIRTLLSSCFIKNQDAKIFSRQRYYNEMPGHRYLLWHNEQLIAHIAVHDKHVLQDGVKHSICGIAEVCVATDFRYQGLVKVLLTKIHQDRKEIGDAYSILFGDTEIYASSGYIVVNNLQVLNHINKWCGVEHAMILNLNKKWPNHSIQLIGIPF